MSISGTLLGGSLFTMYSAGDVIKSQSPFVSASRGGFAQSLAINRAGNIFGCTEALPENNVQICRDGTWYRIPCAFTYPYLSSPPNNSGLRALDCDATGDAFLLKGVGAYGFQSAAWVRPLAPAAYVLTWTGTRYEVIQTFSAKDEDFSFSSAMSRDGKTLVLAKTQFTGSFSFHVFLYRRESVYAPFVEVTSRILDALPGGAATSQYVTDVAVSATGEHIAIVRSVQSVGSWAAVIDRLDPANLATIMSIQKPANVAGALVVPWTRLQCLADGTLLAGLSSFGLTANTNTYGKVEVMPLDGDGTTLYHKSPPDTTNAAFGWAFHYAEDAGILVVAASFYNGGTGAASTVLYRFPMVAGELSMGSFSTYSSPKPPYSTDFVDALVGTEDGSTWLYSQSHLAPGEPDTSAGRKGFAVVWNFR